MENLRENSKIVFSRRNNANKCQVDGNPLRASQGDLGTTKLEVRLGGPLSHAPWQPYPGHPFIKTQEQVTKGKLRNLYTTSLFPSPGKSEHERNCTVPREEGSVPILA